jgi:cell wall-associated NlpC family hydrolase
MTPLVVAVTVIIPATRAVADPVSQSQNQLNQISNQLQGVQAQANQIQSQLQADGAKLDELAQQYEVAQQQVAQLDAELTATRAQIAATQAHVLKTQTQLRDEALQAYTSGATDSEFAGLFSSGGETSMATQEYQKVAGARMQQTIDTLHQLQQSLGVQESQLQGTETQARAAAAHVATSEQQAQAVQAQQQATLSQVKGQVATLLAQQQQARQQLAAAVYAQQVAAAQAAAAAAAQRAAAAAAAQHPGAGGGGGGGPVSANVPVAPGAQGAVQAAESQLGVPYVWGGESPRGSPNPGFDCSGLTQWSWGQAGVAIPRTAQEQYDAIPHVPMSAIVPGDLIFWNDGTTSVQHVGMYVGNGDVIDAPQTGENVQIQPIWYNGLVGAGRP